MKPKIRLICGLIVVPALLFHVSARAQVEDSGSREGSYQTTDGGSLEQAVALFDEGKLAEAKAVFAEIGEAGSGGSGGATSIAAGCYEFLCLHGLGDFPASWALLESMEDAAADVPPEIREDFAWARLDVVFHFRKFKELFPAIESFRAAHPGSNRLSAVAEFELAARYERGLKKSIEAGYLVGEKAYERRALASSDLKIFLSLVDLKSSAGYAVLAKRNLRDERWTARVILGEEAAILEEIAGGDAATREAFHLLRALLFPKIRPGKTDDNLKVMADFHEAYPESGAWPRVELEMAGVALREGERLALTTGPAAAASYLDFTREWFGRVVADDDAGIEVEGIAEADVWDAREGMMRASFWQKDDGELGVWTESALLISEPGDKRWRQAKLFDALARIREGRYAAASPLLGEVADLGFTGEPGQDGVTLEAVRWLAFIALRSNDSDTVRELVREVHDSACDVTVKEPFMKEYAWVD